MVGAGRPGVPPEIGDPTGIINDEGAPTYYLHLPGGEEEKEKEKEEEKKEEEDGGRGAAPPAASAAPAVVPAWAPAGGGSRPSGFRRTGGTPLPLVALPTVARTEWGRRRAAHGLGRGAGLALGGGGGFGLGLGLGGPGGPAAAAASYPPEGRTPVDPLVPFCGRLVGRAVLPHTGGVCSPSPMSSGRVATCPSCARLADSLRLARLRYMFGASDRVDPAPASADHPSAASAAAEAVCVAALRCAAGQFRPAVALLTDRLGVRPRPHPRQARLLTTQLGLPGRMAEAALARNGCDVAATVRWLTGGVEGGDVSGPSPAPRAAAVLSAAAVIPPLDGAAAAAPRGAEDSPIDVIFREVLERERKSAAEELSGKAAGGPNGETGSVREDGEGADMAAAAELASLNEAAVEAAAVSKVLTGKSTGEEEGARVGGEEEPVLVDGHCLVRASASITGGRPVSDGGKESAARCRMCCLPMTSRLTGKRQCRHCKMCEGCVRFRRPKVLVDFVAGKSDGKGGCSSDNDTVQVILESPIATIRTSRVLLRRGGLNKPAYGPIRTVGDLKVAIFRGIENRFGAQPKFDLEILSQNIGPYDDLKDNDSALRMSADRFLARVVKVKGKGKGIADYVAKREKERKAKAAAACSSGAESQAAEVVGDAAEGPSADQSCPIVYCCPAQLNGSHLHHHPLFLQFTRLKTAHCDIEGPGCTVLRQDTRSHVTWSCATCDFDMCHVCMEREAPKCISTAGSNFSTDSAAVEKDSKSHFDRRVGKVVTSCKCEPKADGAEKSGEFVKSSATALSASAASPCDASGAAVRKPKSRKKVKQSPLSNEGAKGKKRKADADGMQSEVAMFPKTDLHDDDDEEDSEDEDVPDISELMNFPGEEDMSFTLAQPLAQLEQFLTIGAAGGPGFPIRTNARIRAINPRLGNYPPQGPLLGAALALGRRQRERRQGNYLKSERRSAEKMVAQIWNIRPQSSGLSHNSEVVVNRGIVGQAIDATNAHGGSSVPSSSSNYGRVWASAFLPEQDPTRRASESNVTSYDESSPSNASLRSRTPSMAVMANDAKNALSIFSKLGSAKYAKLRGGQSEAHAYEPPASDLTTAEDYCQRIQTLIPPRASAIRTKLYGMIAMGKLGLVGTVLCAASFAPLALFKTICDSNDSVSKGATDSNDAKRNGNESAGPRKRRKLNGSSKSELNSRDITGGVIRASTDVSATTCFCGSCIDLQSAPDGCVGCLRCGHSMHAPCAADLLLGGGVCPGCRDPLYRPCLHAQEVQAAEKIFQNIEKRDARDNGNDRNLPTGRVEEESQCAPISLTRGDIVRISNDPNLCIDVQSLGVLSGGWSPDMLDCRGLEGQIMSTYRFKKSDTQMTEPSIDEVPADAYRVRLKIPIDESNRSRRHCFRYVRRSTSAERIPAADPFLSSCVQCNRFSDDLRLCVHCETCMSCLQRNDSSSASSCAGKCDKTVHQWVWHNSLISFVKRGHLSVPTSLDEKDNLSKKDDVAIATQEAQKHMMRLRAELSAITAARDIVRLEANSLIWKEEDVPVTPAQRMLDYANLKLDKSILALKEVQSKKGSIFEIKLASNLLVLAEKWIPYSAPTDFTTQSEITAVQNFIFEKNLEAAARHVRHCNSQTVFEEAMWDCAYNKSGTYVVKCSSQVHLLAFPRETAPRTGFVLEPQTRFQCFHEHVDKDGNVWGQLVQQPDWPDSYLAGLDDVSQDRYIHVLVGSRVRRGPNWRYGNQDGGEGNEGVILKARRGLVLVKWDGIEAKFRYRYQYKPSDKSESGSWKKEVEIFSATPPPQGWLRMNANPRVVEKVTTNLTCSHCNKELIGSDKTEAPYGRVQASNLSKGTKLLVAATLEHVVVEEVVNGRVACSFSFKNEANDAKSAGPIACIWYRPEDLVYRRDQQKGDVVRCHGPEERRTIDGMLRTRHELALLHPEAKAMAKKIWDQSGSICDDIPPFASCIRGHMIHARCFQTVLLSGMRCPAPGCNESFWLPSVNRDDEHVSCGDSNASGLAPEAESMHADTYISLKDEAAPASSESKSDESKDDAFTMEELMAEDCRMCPACCSGPFLNQHCSDMRTHHGQCAAMAWRSSLDGGLSRTPCLPNGMTFQVSATEISKLLVELGKGKTVSDILPRCPTHNVSVMFNGCRACGHLFTDIGWHNLPKWDPNAKKKVALDKKKLRASTLLCSQIKKETAALEIERDATNSFKNT